MLASSLCTMLFVFGAGIWERLLPASEIALVNRICCYFKHLPLRFNEKAKQLPKWKQRRRLPFPHPAGSSDSQPSPLLCILFIEKEKVKPFIFLFFFSGIHHVQTFRPASRPPSCQHTSQRHSFSSAQFQRIN